MDKKNNMKFVKVYVNCPLCNTLISKSYPVMEVETKCPKCKKLITYSVKANGDVKTHQSNITQSY